MPCLRDVDVELRGTTWPLASTKEKNRCRNVAILRIHMIRGCWVGMCIAFSASEVAMKMTLACDNPHSHAFSSQPPHLRIPFWHQQHRSTSDKSVAAATSCLSIKQTMSPITITMSFPAQRCVPKHLSETIVSPCRARRQND